MGISGLLPFLDSTSKKCYINEFRGMTVAIDSYCWLHKGAFSCADKLARGESTDAYVKYCFKFINLLRSYNIKPIMVFDGQHLVAKKDTEKKRREQRKVARSRATELLQMGRADQALQYFRQCVDITHAMALSLIKECRNNNIDCIVAPYEADAQLAYLNMCGIADIIITEDSDLILFGCSKIFFKFNIDGSGILIEKDKLNMAMKMRADQYSFEKFRYMCIISGCDYLDSLPGIGIKKAHKAISLTHNPDIYKLLPRLPQYLNLSKLVVTEEYIENFKLADATIKHQIIYDPIKRRQLPLTDPVDAGTDNTHLKNAGIVDNSDKAFQLALGNIDPISSKVMDNWNPDTDACIKSDSIWSKIYKKQPLQPQSTKTKVHVKSTKKVEVTISVQDVLRKENEMIEYEKKLEEELKVYHRTEPPLKRTKIEETSPVKDTELQVNIHNPFVKRKRLSKFASVNLDDKTQLISRFFKSKSEDNDCLSTSVTITKPLESEICTTELSDVLNNVSEETNDGHTSPILSSRKGLNLNKPTSLELFRCKSSKKVFRRSNSEESLVEKISLSDPEATQGSSRSDLENCTPENIVSVDSVEETLTSVTIKSPEKTVSSTCRPVGLSRFKKRSQPSILSMFNKMSSQN